MPRRRASAEIAAMSSGLAARMLWGAAPIVWVAGSSAARSRSTCRQNPSTVGVANRRWAPSSGRPGAPVA